MSQALQVKPLQIGGITVELPVVLAPMAGVTDAAYRELCRGYGAGLYVSEMVSARALVEGDEGSLRRIAPGPAEPVRSIQLYTVDPAVTAEATRRLAAHGVQHVDLNMGCPSPKVMKRGGGAALPVRAGLVGAIVRAAVGAAGEVPVTVKMRVGLDDATHTFGAASRAAVDGGAAAVALHGRTAEQLYSGRASRERIAELVALVTEVPVLGNGDIFSAADALSMMDETGCDGVVVGRGCLGRPWLFRDLARGFAGLDPLPAPSLGEVVEVMRRHVRLLVEHKGSEHDGTRDFRKHVGWYLTGYPVGGVRRRALSQLCSIAEADALLDTLDPDAMPEADAVDQPRGHTQGPKPVSLPQGWLDSAGSLDVPEAGADVWTSGG